MMSHVATPSVFGSVLPARSENVDVAFKKVEVQEDAVHKFWFRGFP